MDSTEDLTCRTLLKQILITEPPRTPVGSSEPQAAGSSEPRRSSRRSSKRDAEPQTPQNILRRSLRNKIQENITRKSLPLKRRTASAVLRPQAPSSSMMFDDGETPRHLLRKILQTEPVKSPVVHDNVAAAELQPPSEDNTAARSHSSFELSSLDLPDVTMGNIASAAKGLSRKRPQQSLDVTAFEKRLRGENDAEKEPENAIGDLSSLSLLSSSCLSLKTPFVDVHTEKRGLQRRVSNRRKITEEEFSAALSKQQTGEVSREALQRREVGGEDTNLAGITLGLSKLSEPDVTVDIVNCQTALYDQHDAMTANFSITATEDKPTVMATRLQRDVQEEEERQKSAEEEEVVTNMEEDEGKENVDETRDVSSTPEEKDDAVGFRTFDLDDGVEAAADSQSEDVEGRSEEEEEEAAAEEDEGEEQSPTQEGTAADSQTEEEEAATSSQAEDEDVAQSQTEEEDGPPEDAAAASPSEEEEAAADEGEEQSPTQEGTAADSQTEVEEAATSSQAEDEDVVQSQTEEEDGPPEDAAATSPSEEEEAAAGSHPEDEGGSEEVYQLQHDDEEKPDGADLQTDEDDNDEEGDQEEERHISRRAFRSEGGLVLPVVTATEAHSFMKSKSNSAAGLNTSLERIQNQTGKPDWTKPSLQHLDEDFWDENDPADRKNASFHLLHVSHDAEVSRQQEDAEAAAEEAGEQEEESEDEEEDEDFPDKMPAFVREKIKFFTSSPPALPSFSKTLPASSASEALPGAKPKQARRRRTGLPRTKTVLPKSYVMSVFKHFAKTKVSADVFPVLNEILDKFFDRVAEDLETYAAHAKRKTIKVEDVELLLRRQGYINDEVPVEVLIEKYLRMDQRKLLIPIATSGNVVTPKIRK